MSNLTEKENRIQEEARKAEALVREKLVRIAELKKRTLLHLIQV